MSDCSYNVYFNVGGSNNNTFAATSSGSQVTTPIFLTNDQSVLLNNLTNDISSNSFKTTANQSKLTAHDTSLNSLKSNVNVLDVSLSALKTQVNALNNLELSSLQNGSTNLEVNNLDISGVLTAKNGNNLDFSCHFIPTENAQFDLGSAEYKIRHLYLSDNSLKFGKNVTLSVTDDVLNISGSAIKVNNVDVLTNLDNVNMKNLTLTGDLTVNGTQTILNSNEVDISDLAIKLASNLEDLAHLSNNAAGIDISNVASIKFNGSLWNISGGDLQVGGNKVALDASLVSFVLKSAFDTSYGALYTSDQVDASFVLKSAFDASLAEYYNTAGGGATAIVVTDNLITPDLNAGASLTTGASVNVLLGKNTGESLTTGYENVAIGFDAFKTKTNSNAGVYIGKEAGANGGGNDAIAIGTSSAYQNSGKEYIAIGKLALQHKGGNDCLFNIAIGTQALEHGRYGVVNQGGSIAIGKESAKGANNNNDRCGDNIIAIGNSAHRNCRSAIGQSIFIGDSAGCNTQSGSSGEENIVIGRGAGFNFTTATNTSVNKTVIVGSKAGYNGIDQNTSQGGLFLGYGAGKNVAYGNQIVLNGSGADFDPTTNAGLFVKPIRNATGSGALFYDSSSGEITYASSELDASFVLKTAFDVSYDALYTSTQVDASFVLKTDFNNLKANFNTLLEYLIQADISGLNIYDTSLNDLSLN